VAQEEEKFATHIIAMSENGAVRDVWTVSKELLEVARPMARKLSITVTELLTQETSNKLAASVDHKNDLDEDHKPPAGFRAPKISDPDLDQRMKRAAKFFGETPAEMVWRAIAAEIVLAETDMVLDPKSGEPIGDRLKLEKFRHRESLAFPGLL